MATIKIALIVDNVLIDGYIYRIDTVLTIDETHGLDLISQSVAVEYFDPIIPPEPDCECHLQGHLMDSALDHLPATGADKGKIVHSNASTGAIEWIATPPSGSGTVNYIPKWTPDGNTLGNSQIFDSTNIGVKTVSPSRDFDINGSLRIRTVTEQTAHPYLAVLDANGNLDYIAKTTFLTAESDTLDSVTHRDATTTNGITIGSLKITDGATSGYYLKCTNVDGTASWASVSATDVYKGTWDASSNTPILHDDPTTAPVGAASGWWYRVVVSGTVNFGNGNIAFVAGDDVAFNGTLWQVRPGAAGYTLPTATDTVLGGVKIDGTTITISSGVISSHALISVANEATDTTCFPIFAPDATGTLAPKSNTNLTYNSNTGLFTSKFLAVSEYVASVKLKVNASCDAGLSSRNVASESIVQFGNNMTTGYTGAIDVSKAGAMIRLDTRNHSGFDDGAYTVFQIQTREAAMAEGGYQVPFQICPAPTASFVMRRTGLVMLNYGMTTPITIISTLATGTKPLTVSSTTMCTNLNADLLDGYHASDFVMGTHTHPYLPLAGGTMDLSASVTFRKIFDFTNTAVFNWDEDNFMLTYASTGFGNNNVLSCWADGNVTFGGVTRTTITGIATVTALTMATGAGAGKLLQSDGSGVASWWTPNYITATSLMWTHNDSGFITPVEGNPTIAAYNYTAAKFAGFFYAPGTGSIAVYGQGNEHGGRFIADVGQSIRLDSADSGFIEFAGNSAANYTKSISTLSIGDFNHAGMIKIKIGVNDYWMPYYSEA
jgi:hypothetical protein